MNICGSASNDAYCVKSKHETRAYAIFRNVLRYGACNLGQLVKLIIRYWSFTVIVQHAICIIFPLPSKMQLINKNSIYTFIAYTN